MKVKKKTHAEDRSFLSYKLAALTAALLAVMILFMFAALAFAGGAFADGLSVSASAPQENATDVPVKGEYWVEFDHNVASVVGNAKCVQLQTAAGKKVASSKWSVELPDEQLEFGLRKYVIIKVKGLDAGKKYRIHLDAGLASRNGATLGADTDISFTTAAKGSKAAALAEPTETAAGSGSGDGTGGGANTAGGESAAGSGKSASGKDAASESTSGKDAASKEAANSESAAGKEEATSSASDGSATDDGEKASDADAASSDEDAAAQEQAQEPEQTPAGTVALLFVIAIVLVAAWALRLRKAQANAPKRK